MSLDPGKYEAGNMQWMLKCLLHRHYRSFLCRESDPARPSGTRQVEEHYDSTLHAKAAACMFIDRFAEETLIAFFRGPALTEATQWRGRDAFCVKLAPLLNDCNALCGACCSRTRIFICANFVWLFWAIHLAWGLQNSDEVAIRGVNVNQDEPRDGVASYTPWKPSGRFTCEPHQVAKCYWFDVQNHPGWNSHQFWTWPQQQTLYVCSFCGQFCTIHGEHSDSLQMVKGIIYLGSKSPFRCVLAPLMGDFGVEWHSVRKMDGQGLL